MDKLVEIKKNPSVYDAFHFLSNTVPTPKEERYEVYQEQIEEHDSADVRIEMTRHGIGEIYINGKKIDCVADVRVTLAAGQTNKVEITVIASRLTYVGASEVRNG